MNATEKLAKLEPHGVRVGEPFGGKPELTADDVNLALGLISDKNAGLVYLAVYKRWPDAVAGATRYLLMLQVREIVERHQGLELALLAQHLGEDDPQKAPRLRAFARDARDAQWPEYSKRYKAIIVQALAECASPAHCRTCGGRGYVQAHTLTVACETCRGSGKRRISDNARAIACGMTLNGYVGSGWRDVYEWTLAKVGDACRRAAEQFGKRMD